MVMNSMKASLKEINFLVLPILLLLSTSCGNSGNQAHTHDHGEDAAHVHDEPGISIDTVVWTEDVELYVEYPPLVVGERIEFVTHLTRLNPYQAVTEGNITVNLLKGNSGIRQTVDAVAGNGIFIPALIPRESGRFQLYFDLDLPDINQRVALGNVQIFPSREIAEQSLAIHEESPGDIEFTKEQAWKVPFDIIQVSRDSMTEVISLAGKWMPEPGTQRMINAPASGNILYVTPNLLEGKSVRKGEHLMTLSGGDMNLENIRSEIKRAEAEFELARSAYERKQDLHELEVISDAEWQKVQRDFEVARARYEQLVQNYSDEGIQLKAPLSGFIKRIYTENGNYVSAGSPLVRIGTAGSQLLKVHLNPADRYKINTGKPITVYIEDPRTGKAEMYEGRVLSMGRSVSEDQPLLPLVVEVKNEKEVIEGTLVKAEISIGAPEKVISIPTSALLENFGRYSVVVQKGGESFEIRPVTLGIRTSERVEISSGLEEGEIVVSEGAYQVKMASMSSSVPAHGHSH